MSLASRLGDVCSRLRAREPLEEATIAELEGVVESLLDYGWEPSRDAADTALRRYLGLPSLEPVRGAIPADRLEVPRTAGRRPRRTTPVNWATAVGTLAQAETPRFFGGNLDPGSPAPDSLRVHDEVTFSIDVPPQIDVEEARQRLSEYLTADLLRTSPVSDVTPNGADEVPDDGS